LSRIGADDQKFAASDPIGYFKNMQHRLGSFSPRKLPVSESGMLLLVYFSFSDIRGFVMLKVEKILPTASVPIWFSPWLVRPFTTGMKVKHDLPFSTILCSSFLARIFNHYSLNILRA
jgi:hypothetical protein